MSATTTKGEGNMTTKVKRHPTRRHSYSVHTTAPLGGQIVGVVIRKRQDDWQAEGIGGRHIGSGYTTRAAAVQAILDA